MASSYKRRKKLIKPRLQLKMSALFLGLVTLMLMLQFALLTSSLHQAANELPSDSTLLLEKVNDISLHMVLVSAAVFLPLTLMVGVLSTFRIAGPLYRFEMFLNAVKNGEKPEDFTLRTKDELHELADLINAATAPLRSRFVVESIDDGTGTDETTAHSDEESEHLAA